MFHGDGNRISRFGFQAECSLLQDHAGILKDDMLRTVLVHPFVRPVHLNGNRELVYLRDGVSASLLSGRGVRNELVQIRPSIKVHGELLSEWISREDRKMTLLVESFDVDISVDIVSLRFRKWEPTGKISSHAWIMDRIASSSKGAFKKGVANLSVLSMSSINALKHRCTKQNGAILFSYHDPIETKLKHGLVR